MLFRSLAFAAALATASASQASGAISASSRLGAKMIERARVLQDAVWLGWVEEYSIKFHKCHSLLQVHEEEGGGGEEGGMLYTQHLVEFQLCPTSSCVDGSYCSDGGQYIINLREFVEMYVEAKEQMLQEACENVRENCYCNDDGSDDDGGDQACENACFSQAGLEECIEDEDEEQQDVNEFMEGCRAMDENGGNNNNWNGYGYQQYFIGPKCASDGNAIHFGVFLDEACSISVDDDVYTQQNYGVELPYSASSGNSLVLQDCISCMEEVDENENQNNNNNNNNNNDGDDDQQDDDRVIQMCEELYQRSGRCEQNIDGLTYADNGSCQYINKILPNMERASANVVSVGSGGGVGNGEVAFILAIVFASSSLLIAVYSCLLYRRIRRANAPRELYAA